MLIAPLVSALAVMRSRSPACSKWMTAVPAENTRQSTLYVRVCFCGKLKPARGAARVAASWPCDKAATARAQKRGIAFARLFKVGHGSLWIGLILLDGLFGFGSRSPGPAQDQFQQRPQKEQAEIKQRSPYCSIVLAVFAIKLQ